MRTGNTVVRSCDTGNDEYINDSLWIELFCLIKYMSEEVNNAHDHRLSFLFCIDDWTVVINDDYEWKSLYTAV